MDKEYDFEFKITLLGIFNSGKTCLSHKYAKDEFEEKPKPTIGGAYMQKLILLNKYKIKIHIWDTCGNERFRKMTKFYYRDAHGLIFVLDLTNKFSLEIADYYIKETINYFNIERIICANRCDIEEERKISKEEIKNYELKSNIKIFETSAKTGMNINEAFNYLIYLILKKRANKQILAAFINIFNIYSDLEISLILYPNCKNILEKNIVLIYIKNM